jgi:hypothetical protein
VSLWLAPLQGADIAVAPPPREVNPDGSREPVPPPGPKENPAEVVERIVKNSKDVGDKLAKSDTGTETRGTQKTILKDIDSLIDQQDNPPPQSGDMSDMNKDNSDQKNQPKNGMDPMGGKQPKDGNQQSNGRKPRQNGGQQPKNQQAGGKDPMNGAQQKPDPGMAQANPMPKESAKAGATPGMPNGTVAAKPTLPIDDSVVKEVWGHLPDKLRQQVSQYYKEQFMPKYSELLKQYYSSLANSPQKP